MFLVCVKYVLVKQYYILKILNLILYFYYLRNFVKKYQRAVFSFLNKFIIIIIINSYCIFVVYTINFYIKRLFNFKFYKIKILSIKLIYISFLFL
jgi:hypothetical protein